MSNDKKSSADICLKKIVCLVSQQSVTIEQRAWVCPFCEDSTEYWLVNGIVVYGCASSTLMSKGRESDCCANPKCRDQQEKFHAAYHEQS